MTKYVTNTTDRVQMDAWNIIRNRFVKIVKVSMENTVTKSVESVEMEQFATV